ncbi:MAG: hypothetical protein WDA16_02040 [Candidatus Thermoplasmatota archaeon]
MVEPHKAILHDAEPRRGKTTRFLKLVKESGKAGILVVPYVGDPADPQVVSLARQVENLNDEQHFRLRIVQLLGYQKCPRLTSLVGNQEERADDDLEMTLADLHERSCGTFGQFLKRTERDTQLPVEVRFDDYASSVDGTTASSKKKECCIHQATARAMHLTPGDLLVVTPEKLRYLLKARGDFDAVIKPHADVIIGFDEFHLLARYVQLGRLDFTWDRKNAGQWWEDEPPESFLRTEDSRGNRLDDPEARDAIKAMLLKHIEVAEKFLSTDKRAHHDEYELHRLDGLLDQLEEARSPEQMRERLSHHWKTGKDASNSSRHSFSEDFALAVPDFYQKFIALVEEEYGLPRETNTDAVVWPPVAEGEPQRSDDLGYVIQGARPHDPRVWVEYARVAGIAPNLMKLRTFHSELSSVRGGLWGSPAWATVGIEDKRVADATANSKRIRDWLRLFNRAPERYLNGLKKMEKTTFLKWVEAAELFYAVLENSAMLVPTAQWEVETWADEYRRKSITLHAITADVSSDGEYSLRFDLIRPFVDVGAEVHLMSATPVPVAYLRRSGIEVKIADDECHLGPPRSVVVVCEEKSRSITQLKHKKDREELLALLSALSRSAMDRGHGPITFFARTREEADWLKEDESKAALGGANIDYCRSKSSVGVEVTPPVVILGWPSLTVTLEAARLYGPLPGPDSWAGRSPASVRASAGFRRLMEVQELVQVIYRSAQPDKTTGVILLSCERRRREELEQVLKEWGYQNIRVDPFHNKDGRPAKGDSAEDRAARELLTAAGYEPPA